MDRKLTGLLLAGVTAMSLFAGCGSEKKAARQPRKGTCGGPGQRASDPGIHLQQKRRKGHQPDGRLDRRREWQSGPDLFATKYVATKGYKNRTRPCPSG